MVKIYGIKNCDMMKKALHWLDSHQIDYAFYDYKKSGVDIPILIQAMNEHGWDRVINRSGTSWRKLPEKTRAAMTQQTAIEAAQQNPSLIRRPLMYLNKKTYLGFDAAIYAGLFNR